MWTNHNVGQSSSMNQNVVPYSISTSNHNIMRILIPMLTVVPYSISTSNHNVNGDCQ